MYHFERSSSEKTWSFPLIIEQGDAPPQLYVPRSDFCITTHEFPVLLLEVASESNNADKYRMLLQGACVVRLANTVMKPKSRFVLKALYINLNYVVEEHTMYQRENEIVQVIVPLISE